MVAGAMFHLGHYCGDGAVVPVFEDVRMREAINEQDWNEVERIAKSYTSQHERWLFKWTVPARPTSIRGLIKRLTLRQPSELTRLRKLYKALGKPKLIITYKDVFSIANRNRISISSDILDGIRGALAAYEVIREFIEKEHPQALMISSEKAISNKHSLIQNLIDFCQIPATEKQIQAALEFVEPVPWSYLNSTKSDLSIGYVEPVNNGSVSGWAKYKHNDDEARVTLLVDDEEVSSINANEYRADLERAGHRHGNCAFTFENIDPVLLQTGSTVRVRVQGDTQDLSNSPQVV